jgi:hypothetical protein
MRWLALTVLVFALAGCGADSGRRAATRSDCAAAVSYRGALYVGIGPHRHLPARRGRLAGGRVPACAASRTRPTALRRLAGIPPAVAVYARRPFPGVYLNAGSFAEVAGHPLHKLIYGSARKPVWKLRGPACAVRGTVADVGLGLRVRTATRKVRFVHVDVRTRIAGFRHGVLRPHDHVFVKGRCAREDVLARRIRPLLRSSYPAGHGRHDLLRPRGAVAGHRRR